MQTEIWLWLAHGLGPGALNSAEVLQKLPCDVSLIPREVLSLCGTGAFTKAQEQRLQQVKPQYFLPVLRQAEKQSLQILTPDSTAYPSLLKSIASMPPVLYVKGDASLLNGHLNIGMIGARRPSAYGLEAMRCLGRGVAEGGAVIVSGLAAGLDAEAHKAALAAKAPTIACIAFGHNLCYPAANRKLMQFVEESGAVISEYPPDTGVEKRYFLHRNRLIAGLSQALVVVEARPRSGTMNTVSFAQDFGRDVFAVPGSILSELSAGTNAMLREGAYVAASAFDVLSMYTQEADAEGKGVFQTDTSFYQTNLADAAEESSLLSNIPSFQSAGFSAATPSAVLKREEPWQQKPQPHDIKVSGNAQLLQKQLTAQPKGLDELCSVSGLAPGAALAALSELEIAGLAIQMPGRRFTINH